MKKLFLGLLVGLSASACAIEIDDPEPVCTTAACRYAVSVSDANRNLDNFGGNRAADLYLDALDHAAGIPEADLRGQAQCTATYGVMLSRIQHVLQVINRVVNGAIQATGVLEPDPEAKVAALQVMQELPLTYAQDLGELIENYYDGNFRAAIDDIIRMAEVLETEPFRDCVFIAERGQQPGFTADGVTFRLLSNDDPDSLRDPQTIAVEFRVGERWDRVEARLIHTVFELVRTVIYGVISHDLLLTDQQWAQVQAFGRGFVDEQECALWSGDYFGEEIDQDLEREVDSPAVNGIVDRPVECQAMAAAGDPSFAANLRSLAFLFADNPSTFARHDERRWDYYAPRVATGFTNAFVAQTPTIDDMVLRTVRHAEDPNLATRLGQYALTFNDIDADGIVGSGDTIGLNVLSDSIKIKLPAQFADQQAQIEQLSGLALDTLLTFTVPSREFIETIQGALRNLADQFAAVSDTTLAHEPFLVADLQPLLSATEFFGEAAMPNALALDFTAFFNEDGTPPPLRDLVPYWEAVTSISFEGEQVNEFIIEEELPAGEPREFAWQTTQPASAPNGDAMHFLDTNYQALDPFTLELVDGPEPANVPVDCMVSEDEPESVILDLLGIHREDNEGIVYIYFRDPTFNGLVQTKTNAILPPCLGDSNTFEPADLWSLHRTMIAYWRWFNENCTICELISSVAGKPGEPVIP